MFKCFGFSYLPQYQGALIPAFYSDFTNPNIPLSSLITFSRASNATDFDSTGTLQTAGSGVARANAFQDYNPSTLSALGFLIEEQRTNSIRNNTMVGAVASVSRNIGTISAVTRTASTTVVVASTGHTAVVGDMITVSGATPSAYNGTFPISAVVANVSYSYVSGSSATDSATGYAISILSPGTLPTNWVGTPGTSTIARSITLSTSESGIECIDIRYVSKAVNPILYFETATNIAASNGQTWSTSFYARVVGGSTSGATLYKGMRTNDSGGSQVEDYFTAIAVSSAALATQRFSRTDTLVNASSAYVQPYFYITYPTAIDVTIRIGLPQIEQGSFSTSVEKSSVAAVTRLIDLATITGASFSSFYSSTGFSYVSQFRLEAVTGTRPIASFDDNTANQQIRLYASGTSLKLTVTNGGATQADITIGTVAANTTYKCAIRVAASNFAGCLSGGTVQTAASGTMPTVDRMRIGGDQAGNAMDGWQLQDSFYRSLLPNSTLQSLST